MIFISENSFINSVYVRPGAETLALIPVAAFANSFSSKVNKRETPIKELYNLIPETLCFLLEKYYNVTSPSNCVQVVEKIASITPTTFSTKILPAEIDSDMVGRYATIKANPMKDCCDFALMSVSGDLNININDDANYLHDKNDSVILENLYQGFSKIYNYTKSNNKIKHIHVAPLFNEPGYANINSRLGADWVIPNSYINNMLQFIDKYDIWGELDITLYRNV